MMNRPLSSWALALPLLLVLTGCSINSESDFARLHSAQRDFWRARHFQQRLDIYPSAALAEVALTNYQSIVGKYPPENLPAEIDNRESLLVKVARVGAMASLGAASLLREEGRADESISLIQASCRPDLPLGSNVERRLRRTLADIFLEQGEPARAIITYRSLLDPLGPDLTTDDAAYPDQEALDLLRLTVKLAHEMGDTLLIAGTMELADDYLTKIKTHYPGGDVEWNALLQWVDLNLEYRHWDVADLSLVELVERFPRRAPWRAELRRARLLDRELGRGGDCDLILRRWMESPVQPALVSASNLYIRRLMKLGQLDEALVEIRELKRKLQRPADKAELLYIWGLLELKRGAWDEARPIWGQAAANHPYTPYGMTSQLAVAEEWAGKDETRFSARSLSRLFKATRRNIRHYTGSELARKSMELESRGDSLLGTLPAYNEAVIELMKTRKPDRGAP
jgi:tetratricopeptide (TPR) repeat protein